MTGWPLAALVIAVAAWLPAPLARQTLTRNRRTITLPLALGLACLSLLVLDHFERVNWIAMILAASALAAVVGRLALTFADNIGMLARSRQEALTDALTGLGNRRALVADLDRALTPNAGDRPIHVLALFDLDGFKSYNDTFGHPAGDSLLARLGSHLTAFVVAHGGGAYRVGGDELCLLCAVDGEGEGDAIVAEAAFRLTERGDGFSVGCSFGSILLPDEATDAETALRAVDQRLHGHKQDGRICAGRQSKDVLRRALFERHPGLEEQGAKAAALADAVGRHMRLPAADIEAARLAAELCNVGTVAIPDSILRKPGELDEAETAFMRRHPIVGERILAVAPSLANVAGLVRSSHERTDGSGYPDGLRGDDIPLGARIVFACDSYVAMLSERSHAASCTPDGGRAELLRCAGSQFDPAVVQALCDVLQQDGVVSLPGSAGPSPA